jgi:hypothetical protein
MSTRRIAARAAVVGIGLLASLALTVAPSSAAGGMKLCVPTKEGAGLVTPKHGKCKRGYRLTTLGAEGKAGADGKQGAAGKPGAEGKQGPEGRLGPEGRAGFTTEQAEQLKALLPYIRFVGNGVAGQPTVQFSGVNVQVVNGDGITESTNGEGNLVIGYDENLAKRNQTGSHDLIVGEGNEFTSFGGLVAGARNAITGAYASVTGGLFNSASNDFASVSGGEDNTASGSPASVSGGFANRAITFSAWVGGGYGNTIASHGTVGEQGEFAAIFGGRENTTVQNYAAIP